MKKKILSITITAALLLSTSVGVFAEEFTPNVLPEGFVAADGARGESELPISPQESQAKFIKSDLTVTGISEKTDGNYFIETVDANDAPVHLHMIPAANTLVYNNSGEQKDASEIKEGDKISAFVDASKPAPAIYPPQYIPEVLIINEEDTMGGVDVDFYDESKTFADIANAANTLTLHLADDIDITGQDGNEIAKDDLAGRNLIVFYDIATMSIPAQTTPNKIIVLNEKAEPYNEDSNDAPEETVLDFSKVTKISVGETQFDYTPVVENGTYMVPVRAVAEGLGLEVAWNDLLQAVSVGTVQMGTTFNIGEDSYTRAKVAPISLGQAPILRTEGDTGVTYVPVSFFTDVVTGNVSIDNDILTISFE